MKEMKQRSLYTYYILSILTLGIYSIITWKKITKDVGVLCEGDGKKTMKYVPAWFLTIITVGIFGLVWKAKLARRINENAERYGLKFSESPALVVICSLPLPVISHFILIKNINKLAGAFNDYNGLADSEADKKVPLFEDAE